MEIGTMGLQASMGLGSSFYNYRDLILNRNADVVTLPNCPQGWSSQGNMCCPPRGGRFQIMAPCFRIAPGPIVYSGANNDSGTAGNPRHKPIPRRRQAHGTDVNSMVTQPASSGIGGILVVGVLGYLGYKAYKKHKGGAAAKGAKP